MGEPLLQHRQSFVPRSRMVFSIPRVSVSVWSEKWKKWILVHSGDSNKAVVTFIRRSGWRISGDSEKKNIKYTTVDIRGKVKESFTKENIIKI